MSRLPAKPIPADIERIVLVNPTKYLGNLLIAGGLIQRFHEHCLQHNRSLLVVLDDAFRELVRDALPAEILLFYPRKQISQGSPVQKLKAYLACLHGIRAYKADLAFNIEEDAVSHRLTQLSGARFRLGCSTVRHGRGYEHVVPISFSNRPEGAKHRWYSYLEMFSKLGMTRKRPRYMRLQVAPLSGEKLQMWGLEPEIPYIVMHAGATKDYKKWPLPNFIDLAGRIISRGITVVLIGAGPDDSSANSQIFKAMKTKGLDTQCVDLSNRLKLHELAGLLSGAKAMVGNDSGPFHLAAALKVPGVVIFGPTDVDIWHPLSNTSVVIVGARACDPACSRGNCVVDKRCLRSTKPGFVMNKILSKINS
ncbi:MAG: glycosyltransferase family 9 protein [Pseudohongiellaceae bacterium]